ncbi:MAG: hypothetical protein ABI397_03080 [Candidatus Saccharimonas sp.]
MTHKISRFRNRIHRFRRQRRDSQYGQWRDRKLDHQHITQPLPIDYVCKSTDFFDCGEERVAALLQRRPEVEDLERYIDKLREQFKRTHEPLDGLTALLAQAPRASLAQIQMDAYPHGYRNKKERLFELIDFNDTLMDTILTSSGENREAFRVRAKQAADRVCQRVGAPVFTEDQWTAIIRGLTREIAVYVAARNSGFNAWLTDRAHDALGVDIQVQDPASGHYINIDVKTPSSFRRRMELLVQEGRLTEQQLIDGDKNSFIIEHNGPANDKVQVIVLCILPDLFGELVDWRFVDSEPMRRMLNRLIHDYGINDGKYGKLLG